MTSSFSGMTSVCRGESHWLLVLASYIRRNEEAFSFTRYLLYSWVTPLVFFKITSLNNSNLIETLKTLETCPWMPPAQHMFTPTSRSWWKTQKDWPLMLRRLQMKQAWWEMPRASLCLFLFCMPWMSSRTAVLNPWATRPLWGSNSFQGVA